MSTSSLPDSRHGVANSLVECFTPEVARRVVALRLDPTTDARMELLAEKANEGRLTSEERDEYESLNADLLWLSTIQALARAYLRQPGA